MTTTFLPGLALSKHFYWEAVRPILTKEFPGLPHTAALIGHGSEVLGFDTPMSADHDWGPRLMLFLHEPDFEQRAAAIQATLANSLPKIFRGYTTHFTPPDPEDGGTQAMTDAGDGPINHRVELHTLRGYFENYLGYNIDKPLTPADWLTFAEQHLRSITAGAVYHDDIRLAVIRQRFTYYPHDVWLYLLACGWARIGQEEHLMGRAGYAGDEIGSALIASRLVRDAMRLCFLMERTYAPYPKWFGTAFQQLANAPAYAPQLEEALAARTWQAHQQHLVPIYEALAQQHNRLGLTQEMPEKTMDFFSRPFSVIAQHGFCQALLDEIRDPAVTTIAQRRPIGSIDQFSDNTDLLSDVSWRPVLKELYQG